MDFLRTIQWTPIKVLKALGAVFAVLIILSVATYTLKPVASMMEYGSYSYDSYRSGMGGGMMAIEPGYAFDEAQGYGGKDMSLSVRNVAGTIAPAPSYPSSVGGDAEEYETMQYSVSIEARTDETCTQIAKLKEHAYVVFENANTYDAGCSFSFKVELAHVDEVLSILRKYGPKELIENTQTIKQQIDDFTSETEILEKKLESIDETLQSALTAYSEITGIATRTGNAEALAKIIESRLAIIERLTQERITVAAQLERLARSKEQQLDRLVYTYFSVSVYEHRYIDPEQISDSWKQALQEFVYRVNRAVQDITINLVVFVLAVIKYGLYIFVVLIALLAAWRVVKRVWQRIL